MTEPRSDEVVHQAFFGWSPEWNRHTILASSLDGKFGEQWRAKLQDYVRLQPVHGAEVPHHAMSYLTLDNGHSALVRRVHLGHSSGRGNAHALIGRTSGLDVSLALGLENWPQWRAKVPETGLMDPIALSSLTTAARSADPGPDEIAGLASITTTVLARLLDRYDEPLSIIGCLDADRLGLVRCLRAAADLYLQHRGIRRLWSFSTYEDRHDDSRTNLPEIVFLPMRNHAGSAQRNVVDLGQEPRTSGHTGLAGELVANLRKGAPTAVVADLNGNRQHDAPKEDSIPRQHEPAPRPSSRESAPSWQGQGAVAQKSHRVEDIGTRSVEELLATTNVMRLHSTLLRLAKLDGHSRESLRVATDVGVLDRVTEFVDVNTRYELMGLLLTAMYGSECQDLQSPEALGHAARLVENGQSEQLAIMLGDAAKRHNKQQIVDAVYKRWAATGLRPRPTLGGRMARGRRFLRRRWHFPVIAGVALLAVLGLVFVLGYLAGSPAVVQQSAAAPEFQVQTTISTPPQQAPLPPATGTAHIQLQDTNHQVYAFVTVGNSYYPQGACVSQDEPSSTWLCTKTHNPPERQGSQTALVAVPVLHTQVTWLDDAAASGRAVERNKDWGKSSPILP
jgi:hypothetical protein